MPDGKSASPLNLVVDHLAQADALLPLPAIYAYLSPTMQCLFVSSGFENWIRLPREEMLQKEASFLHVEPSFRSFETNFYSAIKNAEIITADYLIRTQRGRRWTELTFSPCVTANNEIVGLCLIVNDIQYRKTAADIALKEKRKQLKLVSDGLPAPLAYLDRHQRFQFANRAYLQWLGKSFNEIFDLKLETVISEVEFNLIKPYIERALQGEPISYERTITMPDGSQRWVRVNFIAEFDQHEQIRGVWAIFTNIDPHDGVEPGLITRIETNSQ